MGLYITMIPVYSAHITSCFLNMFPVLLLLAILSPSAAGDEVSAAGGQEPPPPPPTQKVPFPPPTSTSDFSSTPTLPIFNGSPPPMLPSSTTIINCCSSGSGNNGVTWLLGGVAITLTISVTVTPAVKFGFKAKLSPKSPKKSDPEIPQHRFKMRNAPPQSPRDAPKSPRDDGEKIGKTGNESVEIVKKIGLDYKCDTGGFDCRCNTGGWGDNIIHIVPARGWKTADEEGTFDC